MPGRRPIPTVVKLLTGSKRRVSRDEPTPQLGAAMPAWLSPEAQKHWPTIAPQLEQAGILTQIDATALAMFCEAFARWKAATDEVAASGCVITNARDVLVQSPHMRIANTAFDQLRKMLVDFGMTPSSRSRVSRVPPDAPKGTPRGLASFR